MSIGGAATIAERGLLSIDFGWRNFVFSLQTAAAAILALAIAYWLQLSDPQWATLTVYVLAQTTFGAALAKGAWRAVGTVAGGLVGLVVVGLFSQAPAMLVGVTVLLMGASFYAGGRVRNFASYGLIIGGYTMLLVAYEGSSHPLNAWSLAADRITEILIGIACGALMSAVVLPRHAGDALRQTRSDTLSALASYVATALRLTTPAAVFAQLRARMVVKVVSFDALRSSALFEQPELRVQEDFLRRMIREFLLVLSVSRGLFVRLEEFDNAGSRRILDRLRPTLAAIAAGAERVAADRSARRDLRLLRKEILSARIALKGATAELEQMVGAAPLEPLVDGLLILNRVGDLLHRFAMVLVVDATIGSARRARRRSRQPDFEGRREALLIAVRASIAVLVLSCWWLATGWDQGFAAISGGAIMLFFGVNQDNPQVAGRTYLIWSIVGILVAYLTIVFVLPRLEGFEALALVLLLLLTPAGLMAGTPRWAVAGVALGGWTILEIGVGNVFKPDERAFVNGSVALILGMMVCLTVISLLPVTSYGRRRRARRRTIGVILPAAARGSISPRRAADEIVNLLADLLPRLSLDRQTDEVFFRGTLGAASSAIELGRLASLQSAAETPETTASAIARFRERFAEALERLARKDIASPGALADAKRVVEELRAELSAHAEEGGAGTRSLLRAAASLRFIADRFDVDRAYLDRGLVEE